MGFLEGEGVGMALFKGRDAEKLPLLTQFYQMTTVYPAMWAEEGSAAETED